MQHVEMVFKRLRDASPKVHPGKYVFGADGIDFLGHHISADKLEYQHEKLAAIKVVGPTS